MLVHDKKNNARERTVLSYYRLYPEYDNIIIVRHTTYKINIAPSNHITVCQIISYFVKAWCREYNFFFFFGIISGTLIQTTESDVLWHYYFGVTCSNGFIMRDTFQFRASLIILSENIPSVLSGRIFFRGISQRPRRYSL